MALSPEAIISLVTLIVTCPPSLLLAWAFLKRTRRTLFASRLLHRQRPRSTRSQISNQYNPDNSSISFDSMFYRLHTYSELESWSYSILPMRVPQTLSPIALLPSTIQREPTLPRWDPPSERFRGTVIVERHSVAHASLAVHAPAVEIV